MSGSLGLGTTRDIQQGQPHRLLVAVPAREAQLLGELRRRAALLYDAARTPHA